MPSYILNTRNVNNFPFAYNDIGPSLNGRIITADLTPEQYEMVKDDANTVWIEGSKPMSTNVEKVNWRKN